MFDRYFVTPRPQTVTHNHRTEVHEHRAPTDESVKLLREMQAEAERDRVATFKLDGNGFNGVVEVFNRMDPPEVCAHAVFDLNGKRMTVEARVDPYNAKMDREHLRPEMAVKMAVIEKLRDAVAAKIANEILRDALAARWPA